MDALLISLVPEFVPMALTSSRSAFSPAYEYHGPDGRQGRNMAVRDRYRRRCCQQPRLLRNGVNSCDPHGTVQG